MTYWIDVRSAEEFIAGHVVGAVNIPHELIAQQIDSLQLAKNTDIRVYCRTGRRSGIAKELLDQMGYQQVKNEGGYEEILSRGL